jgi:hypothetical protein
MAVAAGFRLYQTSAVTRRSTRGAARRRQTRVPRRTSLHERHRSPAPTAHRQQPCSAARFYLCTTFPIDFTYDLSNSDSTAACAQPTFTSCHALAKPFISEPARHWLRASSLLLSFTSTRYTITFNHLPSRLSRLGRKGHLPKCGRGNDALDYTLSWIGVLGSFTGPLSTRGQRNFPFWLDSVLSLHVTFLFYFIFTCPSQKRLRGVSGPGGGTGRMAADIPYDRPQRTRIVGSERTGRYRGRGFGR